MPNGKPGDHPLTDVLHGMTGYSKEADALIREISRLLPPGRIWSVFDWDSPPPLEEFTRLLRAKRDELLDRARRLGWDLSAAVPGAVALEDLLKELESRSRESACPEIWVPERVTLNGVEISGNIVTNVLADKAESLRLEPDGTFEADGGTTHRYRLCEIAG